MVANTIYVPDKMSRQRSLENLTITVIGAGFGGLAAAIELASKGAHVRIFESYPDTKKQGKAFPRITERKSTISINSLDRRCYSTTCECDPSHGQVGQYASGDCQFVSLSRRNDDFRPERQSPIEPAATQELRRLSEFV